MSHSIKLTIRNLAELQAPPPLDTTENNHTSKRSSTKRIRKTAKAVNLKTLSNCKKLSGLEDPLSPNQKRISDYFKIYPKIYRFEEMKSIATIEAKSHKRLPPVGKLPTTTHKVNSEDIVVIIDSDDENDLKKDMRKLDLKKLRTNRNKAENSLDSKDANNVVDFSNQNFIKSQSKVKKKLKEKSNFAVSHCEEDFDAQLSPAQEISSRKSSIDGALSSIRTFATLPSDKTSKSMRTLSKSSSSKSSRKLKICPPYKIVEGTSFAVDAFQYGNLDGITHYFLTHFHADHYIGLTGKFSMPIFMSSLTARLVRAFIPVKKHFLHTLELNEKVEINDWEITALDANHCPGAIMLFFKHMLSGKCHVHTGDFRACHQMESEPIFWNNVDIDTLYLDTTYISEKCAFCTQHESINQGKETIKKFQESHPNKKILYVCGSYLVGKEKFWSALAEEYDLKVWSEKNRRKALDAMNEEKLNDLLVDDPYQANMHILAMVKLSYLNLVDYFASFETHFDIILALRPSGWEKNSRPQYRGKINIVGVEYSEHSSFEELRRFVRYLKPRQVISTVPVGKDPMITALVPQNWYKYQELKNTSNYQTVITSYMSKSLPLLRPPAMEEFVSPLKKTNQAHSKSLIEKSSATKENTSKKSINKIIRKCFSEKYSPKLQKTEQVVTSGKSDRFFKCDQAYSQPIITKENISKQKKLRKKSSNVRKHSKKMILKVNPIENESGDQTIDEINSKLSSENKEKSFLKAVDNSFKYKPSSSESLAIKKNISIQTKTNESVYVQKLPKNTTLAAKSTRQTRNQTVNEVFSSEFKEQNALNLYKNENVRKSARSDSVCERTKNFLEEIKEKPNRESSTPPEVIFEPESLSSEELPISQKRVLTKRLSKEKQNSSFPSSFSKKSKLCSRPGATAVKTQSLDWMNQVQFDPPPKLLSHELDATDDWLH
uniref:Lactamase_B domain-containing protein n=1 Tax=Glossina brevipalpis TaxID=37001 RepID=A0A1A9X1V4_9MUSC